MPDKKTPLTACLLVAVPAMFGGCMAQTHPTAPSSAAAPPLPLAMPAATTISPVQNDLQTLIHQSAGLGGGWIVGASVSNVRSHRIDLAQQANRRAQQSPALTADVKQSDNADLNRDGFVTLDEILALHRAGIDDQAIIQRLNATGDEFQVTQKQQQYLRERGIGPSVIEAMRGIK